MFQASRRLARVAVTFAFVSALAFLFSNPIVSGQSASAPGGFMESATGVGLRRTLSAADIRAFLPSRGTFTFPSPYGTTGVRLTTDADCGGADCVLPVGYSYWNNINNHAGSDTMLVFLGLHRQKGESRADLSVRASIELEHGRRLVLQRHPSERALRDRRRAAPALRRHGAHL